MALLGKAREQADARTSDELTATQPTIINALIVHADTRACEQRFRSFMEISIMGCLCPPGTG
jgi:hypothetical protein